MATNALDYARAYRVANRDKINAAARARRELARGPEAAYRERNRELLRQKADARNLANDPDLARRREWRALRKQMSQSQRHMEYLDRNPDKKMLWRAKSVIARDTGLPWGMVPNSIAEASALLLQLKRELRSKR